MSFKIPIGYRELEDNGTEVVYNDGTSLSLFGGNDGEGEDGMIVNVTITSNNDRVMDKTVSEIKSAMNSGKHVICVESSATDTFYEYITAITSGDAYVVTTFAYNDGDEVVNSGYIYTVNNDGYPVWEFPQ